MTFGKDCPFLQNDIDKIIHHITVHPDGWIQYSVVAFDFGQVSGIYYHDFAYFTDVVLHIYNTINYISNIVILLS